MRSRFCSFQFLLGIANAAFLRSESHGTNEHILFSLFFKGSLTGGPGSCIYFPQEQGSPVISPGMYIPFVSVFIHEVSREQTWIFMKYIIGEFYKEFSSISVSICMEQF
jgi:hypothetical protein